MEPNQFNQLQLTTMRMIQNAKSFYEILGVHKKATEAEIKRAYYRLAPQYHPDRNPDPAVSELFKEIGIAYSVLMDPHKRAMYDNFGEKGLLALARLDAKHGILVDIVKKLLDGLLFLLRKLS